MASQGTPVAPPGQPELPQPLKDMRGTEAFIIDHDMVQAEKPTYYWYLKVATTL